jgi:outer membrane protein, heavy metal efflux system
VTLTLVLSGCIHYVPRPLPPERVVATFSARGLDDPQLRAALDAKLPARARDWPRPAWDRADLLVAMLYFNDAVAEGRATLGVVSAGRRTARERPNPTIALLTEYANEHNQLTEFASQHGGAPLWLLGLTPDIPLDVGARRSARIAVADLTAQQALYGFMETVWKERAALRRALLDVLMTEREMALLEKVGSDRQAQLEMARRRLEEGVASRGDLDRLVADAVTDEQRLHDARRRLSAARSALAATIGVPVAALDSVSLSWEGLEQPHDVDPDLIARWRDEALLARADVHSAVVGYSIAEESLRLEVAKQYPQVHIGPAYTWDHGIRRVQFNLSLELPVLNQNQGAIGEAEARRKQAGARLEGAIAAAYQDIDEAIRQWQLALGRVADARGPVYDAAQRIFSETERGFEAGSNDRTELVAARVARSLAELQISDAVRTAQEALASLEDALRRPLEGPEINIAATLTAPLEAK